MSFQIQFHDVPHSDQIREEAEGLSAHLETEFPEAQKFAVTISSDAGEGYSTHLHVTGRQVSVNSTAEGREMRDTLVEAFDKAHKQLRKHHDKGIFGRRREGHKSSQK
jgi:ribosome-associated translation inhibitor RaiA